MAVSPAHVEALFKGEYASGMFSARADDDDDKLTEEERTWRVLKLREVLGGMQQAWQHGPDAFEALAEKVGDGSRDASWREPLGESGILGFVLELLPQQGLRTSLRVQLSRIIGNASADTEENRARVLDSGVLKGTLADLLDDDELISYAVPVIYNLCVDYEPAQLQASEVWLSNRLVRVMTSPRFAKFQHLLDIICRILNLLVTQDHEIKAGNPETPSLLLSLATNPAYASDLDSFVGLASAALAYLATESFQVALVRADQIAVLQQAFHDSYARFDLATADPDEAAQLQQLWAAFVNVFAEISALPKFAARYPLGSSVVVTLVSWLSSPDAYTLLQVAACLSLGNIARSDEVSTALVHDVYPPLAKILLYNSTLSSPPSATTQPPPKGVSPQSQLLHAALSFLKNLAIPAANKSTIGALLDPPQSILPRLWTTTDVQPQTQFAAVSLTRLLLTNSPDNARRVCTPLSADPDSPAHTRTNLHVLIDLQDRADAEPTKFETARAIVAVCRVLHTADVLHVLPHVWPAADMEVLTYNPASSTPAANPDRPFAVLTQPLATNPTGLSTPLFDNNPTPVAIPACAPDAPADEQRRAHFYAHHVDVATAFAVLLTQKRFPVLRSEALFVMALMGRSSEGGKIVLRVLQWTHAALAMAEVVTGYNVVNGNFEKADASPAAGGQEGEQLVLPEGLEPQAPPAQIDPQVAASISKADRENGMVVIAQMLRDFSDYMPPMRRTGFEQILSSGGKPDWSGWINENDARP